MSDLIQIHTPAPPRDYANNSQNNRQQHVQQDSSGQVFNLGSQTEVVKTNDRSNDQGQQNLKDGMGAGLRRSDLDTLKDPTSALNTAKALISNETLSLLKSDESKGDELGKLTEFASEVMLTPGNIAGDMAAQQKGSTIFGDKLWSVLNQMSKEIGSDSFTSALADFAKAAASVSSREEILHSLSANFRYLASEAAPGKAVAEELNAAAKALSGTDAAENFEALKPTLLKLISYTEKSLLLNNDTQKLLPLIVHNMSRYSDNSAALKSSFTALLSFAEDIDPKLAEELTKLYDSFVTKNEYLSPEQKSQALMNSDTARSEEHIRGSVNLLAAGAKHMVERIPEDTLMRSLSSIDFSEGTDALRKALGSVIPNTPAMRSALETLFSDLEKTEDLDRMVNHLNTILENIGKEDSDSMVMLAQGLNSALSEMAASGKYSCTVSTSMETLANFMVKNIDDTFLQSLSGLDKNDMVQNMLTAPGVFAPLIHQFVPLDAFGLKAFGELWLDPKSEENGAKGSHMFLCFDIEDEGYFELEIYEHNMNLDIKLLCPESSYKTFDQVKDKIPTIAAAGGYRVAAASVGPCIHKRTLDKVFPKLNEQKTGLNVKV